MKSNKIVKIINFTLVGLFIIFMILGATLPLLTLSSSSSSSTSKIYFFDLFGQISVSGSSSASVQSNYFYGIVVIAISLLGALFTCFENKVLRTIGLSFLVSAFAFYVYAFSEIKLSVELLTSSSSSLKASTGGAAMLLITSIIAILICLTALVEYLLPYLSKLIKPKKSLEERLLEISSLKEKGLISEEEANALREEALK